MRDCGARIHSGLRRWNAEATSASKGKALEVKRRFLWPDRVQNPPASDRDIEAVCSTHRRCMSAHFTHLIAVANDVAVKVLTFKAKYS
jgi:hypothetical protein